MKTRIELSKRIYSLILLATVLVNVLPISAQTRRIAAKPASQTIAANQSKQSAPKCSGGWNGTITYTRTQTSINNKTVQRVSGRGQDTTDFQLRYNYTANVTVIEAPGKNGSSLGKATISHQMTSEEKVSAIEKSSCDRGKTWQEMRGESSSKTEVSGEGKEEASVNVGINDDGTYSVSVGVPEIKGKVSGSETSSFSGQCSPKEGKNLNLPATETTLDGHTLTSDGTTRINPSDSNHLSGSYSLKLPGDVTETITWNLRRCSAALQITDLQFADMKFPNWNEWKEIVEQTGTIDGNLVKIKAKVLNASGETKTANISIKETFKGDKWDGAKPDMPLKTEDYVSIEPGEEKEVEFVWDSSGYAWYDDGRPRLVERIKAEIWEKNKLTDEMTKNLKIAPKPIVLVHGLWSDWRRFETWQNILTTTHSYDWKAFPVGEKPEKGVLNTGGTYSSPQEGGTVSENAAQLKSYIRYAQEDRNAWHVDIVAHSSGGLIARNYITQLMPPAYQDGRPQVAHLVMLGTPNQGSPCADVMYLVSGIKSLYQVTQDFTNGFNRLNSNRNGVKFSALAGNPLPVMCKTIEWNDGFVAVPSAIWNVKDNAQSKSIHTDLTGTKDFSDFVKPHLAIGPKGNHNPEMPGLSNQTGQINQNQFGAFFVSAAYQPQISEEFLTDENALTPDFSKTVKIAANQALEIDLPVSQAANLGISFMADAKVSLTLTDDKGVIQGKNLADSPESRAIFRSIFVDKNVSGGTWKLKIENTGTIESTAFIAAWNEVVKK